MKTDGHGVGGKSFSLSPLLFGEFHYAVGTFLFFYFSFISHSEVKYYYKSDEIPFPILKLRLVELASFHTPYSARQADTRRSRDTRKSNMTQFRQSRVSGTGKSIPFNVHARVNIENPRIRVDTGSSG